MLHSSFLKLLAVLRRRQRRARYLGWLCLLLLAAPAAHAQYRVDHWTADNGLPHNWVRAMLQTRDGYLWLTTWDGIVRFDGVRFRVFNRANTPALTSNSFSYHAIWEDQVGGLWMGTQDGGVIRYHNGAFTAYTTQDGLPTNTVIRIDGDAAGTVWIVTEGGLAQWKNNQIVQLAPAPGSPFNDCLVAPRGYLGVDSVFFGLWRRDAAGWSRFAYGQWTPLPLPPHLTDPEQLRINTIFEDSQRRLWYNLTARPTEFYEVSEGRLTKYQGLPPSNLVCYREREGYLWLTNTDGRFGRWKGGQLTTLPGISTPHIFRVLEDHEGTLWVATLRGGLYRFRKQAITVHRHPGAYLFNAIKGLMQDRAGNIWLGAGGLARFKDNQFENFYRAGGSRNPVHGTNVLTTLFADDDGSMLLGTFADIARFRAGVLRPDEQLTTQIEGRVYNILRDRSGALWLGTAAGLYRQHGGTLTRYGKENGLPDGRVSVLHEDAAGTLWIGTGSGLWRYADGCFSAPTADNQTLPGRITTMLGDEAGTLWVGTFDNGLYRLQNGRLTRFTTAQGLYTDGVYHLLADDHGFFWIACARGIYRVRRAELEEIAAGKASFITSTHFGIADGLINVETGIWSQPVGFKANDGKLWFATEAGVAVIDPKAVPFNPTPPSVVIEECVLDRQAVAFGEQLEFGPGQENLEIHYTGLSFIKSEQMRFKYQLIGHDRDWVEAGARRTAYYSRLAPGSYTFNVAAANSDGVWNNQGKSLVIIVRPPFYQRWWFLTLIALAVGGLVFLAYEYRVGRLKQAQAAQQAFARQLIASQESERKRIAAELHDSLGQSLAIIKNRALLSLGTPDDHDRALEQLREISEASAEVIDEVKEIAHNLRPYQLDRLGLTKTIEGMIKRVAATHDLSFTCELDRIDGLLSPEAEINLFRIVQEGVNNIVKHATATAAGVRIKSDAQQIEVTIQDNGQGFVPDASRADGATRGGFGLRGMAERVRVLGGDYNIQSAPGQGTTVRIAIGLKDGQPPK